VERYRQGKTCPGVADDVLGQLYLYEICALLGYYTASCGNCLPTFRDNVSVPSSWVQSPSRKESQQPMT
jgi:hypothetical protein